MRARAFEKTSTGCDGFGHSCDVENSLYDDATHERSFRETRLVHRYSVTYAPASAVKHTLLSCTVLALSIVALTGCAASAEGDDDSGLLDAAIKVDSAPAKDAAPKKDSGPPAQCVNTCASDQDCENSCPAVPNGVNCCDTSTGICYAYSSTICPEPVLDAGLD